ncbi:vinorine synthase-like [Salvia miltiorrhiza]|uniref:vinorine synthase-like n=1 Tax=Salvia miltiorrhiza TaxID=226208 RepID=UPI0025AC54EA|nr:vinorine synthase-like [Salvia miltiorrhiza]
MLDQIFLPIALPFALYYPNTTQINDPDSFISQTLQQLTRSLSVILTRFYPLAERASKEGEFIDCNDDGVPFTVARFKGHELSEHLADPRPDLLLSCDTDWGTDPDPNSVVALIQVNCSDVAIGVAFWHKVVDASTVSAILRSWGAVARGGKEPVDRSISHNDCNIYNDNPRIFRPKSLTCSHS